MIFSTGEVATMFITVIIGGIIYFYYKTWEQRKFKNELKNFEPKHFDEAAAIRALKFRYENHKVKTSKRECEFFK